MAKGWHGEHQQHSDVQKKGAITNTLRQPMIRLSVDAITKFIDNETNELILGEKAIALRTPFFIFISKEISPNQISELYSRIPKNVGHSGGSVNLEIINKHVRIKNLNEEIKKHKQAEQNATSTISRQMHEQILNAMRELVTVAPQENPFPDPSLFGKRRPEETFRVIRRSKKHNW